jgi:hypothetical protein
MSVCQLFSETLFHAVVKQRVQNHLKNRFGSISPRVPERARIIEIASHTLSDLISIFKQPESRFRDSLLLYQVTCPVSTASRNIPREFLPADTNGPARARRLHPAGTKAPKRT